MGRGGFGRPAIRARNAAVNILSIQSWVAYGHVGNASAVFPLQRLGAEVWAVNTVQFSNHLGYGSHRGQVFDAALIRDCVQGIEDRGVLPGCDAVLSGYIGNPGIGGAVLDAVARVKAANPRALYCCDPVIGDRGRVYVGAGIPELLRDAALPLADIATPNQFELEWLTGATVATLAEAKSAIAALQARGPRCVLVTSLATAETPADALDLLAGEGGRFWRLRTPRIEGHFNGAGDAIAALFLFHRLRGDAPAALSAAASSLHGLLRRTAAAGSPELLTVAAQDEFVAPTRVFQATPC
jgi:pyridoxine kinase